MDFERENKSVISKLSIKGENLEKVASRLHFERLFAATDFLPKGLSKNAIVCIKKLRDPKPATLRLNHAELQFSEKWQESVSREIEKLYQKAYRPIREFVPAEAESLIFSNQSELLACLASDFCDGVLGQHWWWKSLFPNLNQAQTVAEIWLKSIEFAPLALRILLEKEKAMAFVLNLENRETEDLLKAILRVFALGNLQKAIYEPIKKSEFVKFREFVNTEKIADEKKPENYQESVEKTSPILNLLPEIRTFHTDFVRENLLGIGILLAKSPRIIRSNQFAEQIRNYRVQLELEQILKRQKIAVLDIKQFNKKSQTIDVKTFARNEKQTKNIDFSQNKYNENITKPINESPNIVKRTFDEIVFSEKPKPQNTNKNETDELKTEIQKKRPILNFEIGESRKNFDRTEIKKPKNISLKSNEERIEEQKKLLAQTEPENADFITFSRFGGVFYLLNVGIFLNLYRDFTENLAKEIGLNIWDFVALLALGLSGNEVKNDSVWRLLENFSGRENSDVLGDGFLPPNDWRISITWLETFQTQRKWGGFVEDSRLIVRHPANFSVIDIKFKSKSENQFKFELEKYRNYFDEIEFFENSENAEVSKFERWAKNLTEYVKARLLQALNLENVSEISEILFKKNAQINVAANHLDINFSLSDLPLQVRFSGLDRDPGWIPAAGKFVKFHFV